MKGVRESAGESRRRVADERAARIKGERTNSAPGPESCAGFREETGEALTGGSSGQPLSSAPFYFLADHFERADLVLTGGRPHRGQLTVKRELTDDATRSQTLRRDRHSPRGNRETPVVPCGGSLRRVFADGTVGEGVCRTSNMDATKESDDLVGPEKRANKAGPTAAAESVEERGSTKGSGIQRATDRTQCRITGVTSVWMPHGTVGRLGD